MPQFCVECGAVMEQGKKFCSGCGAKAETVVLLSGRRRRENTIGGLPGPEGMCFA